MPTRTVVNTTTHNGTVVAEEVVEVDVTAEVNESLLAQRITAALAELQTLIDYPAVPQVPTGTLTSAQISTVVRALRDAAQQNRAGAQQVAKTLRDTIRLVRGDFGTIDPA